MLTSNLKNLALTAALAGLYAAAPGVHAQTFEMTSADISAGQPIPQAFAFNGFGCTGGNLSPTLDLRNAPAGTKSLAVMVHDPDAVTGGAGFWHWVVINLPATTSTLPQGAGTPGGHALPVGARQIATDFGSPGWGGPCPPTGDKPHRYTFTAYALKVEKLELPTNATASLAGFMINMNALAKASFTAQYGR
jgi:Raf kinase inhibitor-like YbhB/YbcL family protein